MAVSFSLCRQGRRVGFVAYGDVTEDAKCLKLSRTCQLSMSGWWTPFGEKKNLPRDELEALGGVTYRSRTPCGTARRTDPAGAGDVLRSWSRPPVSLAGPYG